jgi:D-serine deaminase-like pyridoxal phosphate-dependent protein
MASISELQTPCLLLDLDIMQRNIALMANRTQHLGVALRPHIKTPKSIPVALALQAAGAQGFTVSTLKEAEYLFSAGLDDVFYAAPADAKKAVRAASMLRAGKSLSLMIDGLEAAVQIAEIAALERVVIPLWIEIDVDHYRTGISGTCSAFDELMSFVDGHTALKLSGLMSYGGASYNSPTTSDVIGLTERHRQALLAGAARAEKTGVARPRLSFGSSPAVLHAESLAGIDEVRCGIYVFQDLFQAGIGACNISDIALSVLATVVSHNSGLNRFTIDAGGLALSKDRSTQGRSFDAGFGLICGIDTGKPVGDLQVSAVSQELGLVNSRSGRPIDLRSFPIGSRVRVLPNHADMTAAAHEEYHVLKEGEICDMWRRRNGW